MIARRGRHLRGAHKMRRSDLLSPGTRSVAMQQQDPQVSPGPPLSLPGDSPGACSAPTRTERRGEVREGAPWGVYPEI